MPDEILESGDDERAIASSATSSSSPRAFVRQGRAALRASRGGELRHAPLQGRPGVRALLAPAARRRRRDPRARVELPGRHRARADPGAAAPPRRPRPAHRAAQPAPLRGGARRPGRPRRPLRRRRRRAAARHRQLQVRQRQPRPPHRRRRDQERRRAACASQLRETDVLARLGGDEFAVLLPHADAEQAQAGGAEAARDGAPPPGGVQGQAPAPDDEHRRRA